MSKQKLLIFDWDGTVTLPDVDEGLVFHPNFMAMIDSLILDRQRNGTERVVVTNGEIAPIHLKAIKQLHDSKEKLNELVSQGKWGDVLKIIWDCFGSTDACINTLEKNGIASLKEEYKSSESRPIYLCSEEIFDIDANAKHNFIKFMKKVEKIHAFFIDDDPCHVYSNVDKPQLSGEAKQTQQAGLEKLKPLGDAHSLQAGQDEPGVRTDNHEEATVPFFTQYADYFKEGKKVVMIGNSLISDIGMAYNLQQKFPQADISALLFEDKRDVTQLLESKRGWCGEFEEQVNKLINPDENKEEELEEAKKDVTLDNWMTYRDQEGSLASTNAKLAEYALKSAPELFEGLLIRNDCREKIHESEDKGKKTLKGQFATIPRESEDGKVDQRAINKALSIVNVEASDEVKHTEQATSQTESVGDKLEKAIKDSIRGFNINRSCFQPHTVDHKPFRFLPPRPVLDDPNHRGK